MKLIRTDLPDLVIIELERFEDERGWFMESFNEHKFHSGLNDLGLKIPKSFVQDNCSFSHNGVLRGLHFQKTPFEQGKLIHVSRGSVFDVAVDIRPDSQTFGKWVGIEISVYNKMQVWIPEGFAHGFLTLEDNTCLHYKTTNFYNHEKECSIIWNDADLGIKWPKTESLNISKKDKEASSFELLINPKN